MCVVSNIYVAVHSCIYIYIHTHIHALPQVYVTIYLDREIGDRQ